MTLLNVGTPDNQRGVFSPQLEASSLPGTSPTATINLPANTESLLIFAPNNTLNALLSVVGVTTGQDYPPLPYTPFVVHFQSPIYVVPVSPAADPSVTITWAGNPGQWYVIADAAVRTFIDPNIALALTLSGTTFKGSGFVVLGQEVGGIVVPLLVDAAGTLSVGPIGADTKQHASVTNGTTILAAPTAGKANRLYKCIISVVTVPENVNLIGVTSGVIYGTATPTVSSYGAVMDFSQPIDCTEALNLSDTTNNQNIAYSLHYRTVNAT